MPANTLAVELYSLSSRDQRAGMDGVLVNTLAAADAKAVIDLHAEHFPTALAKQRCYHLMVLMDRVVTERRSERESAERAVAMARLENESKSKRRR